ncbi:enoyl-CoA hydratase-related protein [Jeotgalibacillus sp. ET6]|uniref:enoyl-CoA hydratase/isomerase family protein n=1 Tax=Jeotgalibacillus sp. ET6 TaxID=3037260 RepID=UPI0024187FD0|nr:enoyl-CoA hydratase-related protein [Jeotgalibacillus sp. ET6]MDG5473041.1 enoyl-CoA hydratase-related protein [Jeotgalibacillus sp. ET6]
MNNQWSHIQTEIVKNAGTITLNRPEVLNALNTMMVSEIVQAMENFDQDQTVKVIVLKGAGRAFAAGADIDEMLDKNAIELELLNQFSDWDRIARIKKPIIGAVHGFVLGGGFELALCCDILLASQYTEFGFPEAGLGIMPGAGGTQRLTKLIGHARAMKWLLTGERFSAEDAWQYGIVSSIVPDQLLVEETEKMAEAIAKKPPLSVRLIKESVHKANELSLAEGMQQERKNFYLLFSSEDQKEGLRAFKEKRKADFKGR